MKTRRTAFILGALALGGGLSALGVSSGPAASDGGVPTPRLKHVGGESEALQRQIRALQRDYEEGMSQAARASRLEQRRLRAWLDAGRVDGGARLDAGPRTSAQEPFGASP